MYLTPEVLTTNRVYDPTGRLQMLHGGAVEAAVLRGRKMQSEAFWNALVGLGRAVRRGFRAVAENYRQRQALDALRQMDAHTLSDIGLTPSDIEYAVTHGRYHETVSSAPSLTASPSVAAANDTARAKPRQAA
jgi:uncharacterized protein YjiS (DUF1127 family)